MAPFHVADETFTAIVLFGKTQGRIPVTMPMIFHSPALRFAATNGQAKRTCNPQDRDISPNPRNIWPRYLLNAWNDGERLTHGTTRSGGRF
jgi:hypothetical protein